MVIFIFDQVIRWIDDEIDKMKSYNDQDVEQLWWKKPVLYADNQHNITKVTLLLMMISFDDGYPYWIIFNIPQMILYQTS